MTQFVIYDFTEFIYTTYDLPQIGKYFLTYTKLVICNANYTIEVKKS